MTNPSTSEQTNSDSTILVDILLVNAHVLTMDEKFSSYPDGAVAVANGQIQAVGPRELISRGYRAAETVDCGGKVLMPGLVNAHTHVPMTLLRGLADDLRLDVWLMGYMMPVEREFVSPDFVRLGTLLGCAEMIRSGVTTFADMYYYEEAVARAAADAGIRALCAQTVLKFSTPDASSFEESLAASREFIARWKGHELIVPGVAPHAPYTCTAEILKACASLAVEFDVPLHTHIAETALEVDNMRSEQGMPVVPYVKKQGLLEAKVLAAHCVHIDEGEMRTLRHAGAGVSHNPSSNLKLGSGFAPVRKMLEVGLNVGIGTDGPASNNDLDMFEEVRLAAFVAKGSTGDPTALPARTTLAMATRLGARAMHMGDITGSLEPGKRADLILVDVNPIHNSPRFERDQNSTYAQIVYASKATDVSDVMVNGKWLLRQRILLTLNEEELIHHSREYARKIDLFLIAREQSVLSKLIAIGGAAEEESFEVQIKVPIPGPETVLAALERPDIEILRMRHYHEYDTYFLFPKGSDGRLRYREDEFIDESNRITNVRSRLTLIGADNEGFLPEAALLSRSRYLAPASHSLRFYREYFKPDREVEIEKDRLRFLIRYEDVEFFINIDNLLKPNLGYFLEVKSRTWSRKDAEVKSKLASQLVDILGAAAAQALTTDYFDVVEKA